MTNLIEFLSVRLVEDEAAAQVAAKEHTGEWRVTVEGDIVPDEPRGNEYVACGPWDGGIDDGTSEHIVRHDPARALREVEAKRRMLACLLPDVQRLASAVENGHGEYERAPDDLLHLLALPYSDHPDYDEAWRP